MDYVNYGLLTLLPAILVLVFAIATKKTTEALIVGCLASYAVISGFGFISSTLEALLDVVTNRDNQWMIVLTGFFGSLIALLNASKATNSIARFLGKFCKGAKSTLIATWILGIVIFIDDTLNILAVSSCMKKLSDRNKVPREALAYVVDSTTAPACVVFPFSTWVIFYANVFWDQEAVRNLGFGSAMSTYYRLIPYVFYGMAALVVVPLFAFGLIPKIGPMKKAFERTAKTGKVFSEASAKLNAVMDDPDEAAENSGNVLDFLLPIGILIALTIIVDDMLIGVIAAIFVCMILFLPRKKITFSEFCELWIKGFTDMIPALAILVAALLMRKASSDLHLPEYVVNAVGPLINARVFPLITFVIVSALSFVTGSCWGIPGICTPILVPLAVATGANMILVLAAIVSAGTFGSHACFYSDATVITSITCGIDNMDHAKTQIPYAMIAFAVTCIGYIIVGFAM